MNSDPFDSAAWRVFNMLAPDEATRFDDALRHDPVLRNARLEMDRLAAAIAATSAIPLDPRPGQLERLQSRVGHGPPKSATFWLAVSGWSTAAVLAVLVILLITGIIGPHAASPAARNPSTGASATSPAGGPGSNGIVRTAPGQSRPTGNPALSGITRPNKETDAKSPTKVETKRLNQEIEVLRENLEKFQSRDRVLFEAVPGVAFPMVMTMNPPGLAAEDPAVFAKNDERSPLATLLGDALTSLTATADTPPRAADAPALPEHPTAIPIYDAARDLGSLVVSNLPPVADGESYNLWVTTQNSGHPIYVGSLPDSSAAGADSFDFTLGSTMILPSP